MFEYSSRQLLVPYEVASRPVRAGTYSRDKNVEVYFLLQHKANKECIRFNRKPLSRKTYTDEEIVNQLDGRVAMWIHNNTSHDLWLTQAASSDVSIEEVLLLKSGVKLAYRLVKIIWCFIIFIVYIEIYLARNNLGNETILKSH